MGIVLLTALGVGGATVIGSIIGFVVKSIPRRFSELTLSLAAGIMLSAAVWGLIVPSMGDDSTAEVAVSALGVLLGGVFIGLCEKAVPHLRFVADGEGGEELDSVLLLVTAMALHNLPEGIAAGVSLGAGDLSGAMSVAVGIAIQNLPEGMAVVPPMLMAGISRRRTFLISLATGLVEVAGTFLGYHSVTFLSSLLPITLAFAGGAMLYVIADEMLPRAAEQGRIATYVMLTGFCLMLFFSV